MQLVDIVNQLPRALAHRFDSSFWVNNANKVLQDLEMKGDIPRVKDTFYLLVEEGVCSYKLPSFIKKVLNVLPNDYATGYSLRQDRIILDIADELEYTIIPLTCSGEKGGDKVTVKMLGLKAETPLFKDMVLITDSDQRSFGIQKIIGTAPELVDDLTPPFNIRALRIDKDWRNLIGDEIPMMITDGFVPIEYTKAFNQAEDMLEDILDDTDIHSVLQEGLWYFAMRHIDPDGVEAGVQKQQMDYEREKSKWFNRRTRGMFKQKTRFGA